MLTRRSLFSLAALPAATAVPQQTLLQAKAIADWIRALEPAAAATQAEDAALIALAADQARKHGHCTVRIRRAHDGALQMKLLSYDTYWP